MGSYDNFKYEMYKIKGKYCKKCVYFDSEGYKCSKNKIYWDCFRKHEIIPKNKNVGGTNDLKRP